MPKELFNQPLIESPDQPDDDLHISFGKPGVAGGLNVLWSYLKQLLQGAIDFLLFTPQDPPPAHQEGLLYYDAIEHAFIARNDIPDVALQMGEETWARLINKTGSSLLNGKVGYVSGVFGIDLTFGLAVASDKIQSIRALGLFTNDISNDANGYLTRYGFVRDIDTSMWAPNTALYLSPDTPGELTDVRPLAPNYIVRIGLVVISHATLGVIGVDTLAFNGTDTGVNIEGTLNGMVTQTPDIAFSVSGGIIYADITNEVFPTKNLPFLLDFDRHLLDTTTNTGPGGSARVIIPPGGDPSLAEAAQKSWIYVFLNGGNPDIAVSTSKPSVPHAIIGTVVAYNAATTLARDNVHGYRRENNASNSESEGIPGSYGFTRVLADDARSRGSAWISGQDPTPDVDDLTIQLALSAGVGKQLHETGVPLFDGLLYQLFNDETNAIVNEEVINLIDIILDANGNTLIGNGFYYTLRFYYKLNSNGIGNDIIVTRPQGHYTSGELAESDALKYTTLFTDTDMEDIVYPLYDMVVAKTGGGGGTTTMFSLTSLRSKTPGVGGGSGAGAATTDDKVRISAADTTNDYLNSKITVTGALKTIVNPAGNEVLDFKVNTMYTPDGTAGVVHIINSENVGIRTTSPLQTLHIKTAQGNPGAVIGNFGHNYYGLVVESEDAVLGLVSEDEGGHGSTIDLMEVNGGVLQDKWSIGRFSSSADSRIQIMYGTNADYTTNNRVLDLTTDYRLFLVNAASKIGVRTATPREALDVAGTGSIIQLDTDGTIKATITNPNTIKVYRAADGRMIFNTTLASSTLGGFDFQRNGTSSLLIRGDGIIVAASTITATDFILSSDKRLKKEINYKNIPSIDGLKPATYKINGHFRCGFIAQDALLTHKQLVGGSGKKIEGKIDYHTFSESSIIAMLVQEVQELKAKWH